MAKHTPLSTKEEALTFWSSHPPTPPPWRGYTILHITLHIILHIILHINSLFIEAPHSRVNNLTVRDKGIYITDVNPRVRYSTGLRGGGGCCATQTTSTRSNTPLVGMAVGMACIDRVKQALCCTLYKIKVRGTVQKSITIGSGERFIKYTIKRIKNTVHGTWYSTRTSLVFSISINA